LLYGLAYGLAEHQWPLVVSNAVCFALSAFILAMTLLPKAEKDKDAAAVSGIEKRERSSGIFRKT
jgi:hypothetical protein